MLGRGEQEMIPVIKEYEPPRRRLRIRNKFRFILILLLVICTVSTFFIHRIAQSQTAYRPYQVRFGDTYWDIAKQLQAQGYKPRRDIREIVDELIRASGIPAHQLREGDTIYIPVLEQ